jgi:hypothetical protein
MKTSSERLKETVPQYREGQPITNFNPGEIIVRICPSDHTNDSSYRGRPLKYVKIENNMIYVKALDGYLGGSLIDLRLEDGWVNGWGLYRDPEKETGWRKFINELKEYYYSFKVFCKTV